MKSGRYFYMGRVVEVTPSGVEVKSGVQMFHFDSDGKGRNSEGSHDYGPWHIDDMPFMERVALWEEEAKKFCKTLVVGQEVWVQSGIYCGEGGKVVKVTPSHVYVQSGATSMRFRGKYFHGNNQTGNRPAGLVLNCWLMTQTQKSETAQKEGPMTETDS
jgi:hypothetical protein